MYGKRSWNIFHTKKRNMVRIFHVRYVAIYYCTILKEINISKPKMSLWQNKVHRHSFYSSLFQFDIGFVWRFWFRRSLYIIIVWTWQVYKIHIIIPRFCQWFDGRKPNADRSFWCGLVNWWLPHRVGRRRESVPAAVASRSFHLHQAMHQPRNRSRDGHTSAPAPSHPAIGPI